MKQLQLAMLAIAFVGTVSVARADITGSLWENGNNAYDASTDTSTLGPANVTFSVPNGSLDFDSQGSTYYTIGSWLNTGGATIVTGGGDSANTMDNTIILMTGLVSVTSGEQFTVEQDDGLVLTIGTDTVLNNPGPHSATQYTGTYSGQSGNQPFTLEYSEVSGAPAVLNVDLPFTPVPEPSTILAGVSMLLPFGAGSLRMLRKKQTA